MIKKSFFFLILFPGFIFTTNAQDTAEYNAGGYGYFMTGPSVLITSAINDHLKTSQVLGNDFSGSTLGIGAGGEGFAVMGKFMIGGGGFGFSGFTGSSDKGKAGPSNGGGYFKFWYPFFTNKNRCM